MHEAENVMFVCSNVAIRAEGGHHYVELLKWGTGTDVHEGVPLQRHQ